jgi:hypothetical protein
MSTYDDHREHLTVEAVPNAIGDTQIYAGREYVYTGTKWIPLEDDEPDANDDNEA